eukprot:FR737883.1.p2 GENE.FR737883.1~~FR737883.1.p2  ORF type:complete len:175 (+),score=23.11 FR737883.1:2-526(+)
MQQTSSVHNTPIENLWRWVNQLLEPFLKEFQDLENAGLLRGGVDRDNDDLFCLHYIYLDDIKSVVDHHFQAFNMCRKRKSTRNPRYPPGAWRPCKLLHSRPPLGVKLRSKTIAALEQAASDYWGPAQLSPWQIDPLVSVAQRERRDAMMVPYQNKPLSQKYMAFRSITKVLKGE